MRSLHPLLFLCATVFAAGAMAQATPAPTAIKLPDSLVFTGGPVVANASVVWHPVNQRYYSVRMGAAGFPLHTWLPTGGLSTFQSTTGIDTRGMWYNPNTGLTERNCFNALGWATVGIDGALNADNTFTTLFPGMLQPNSQSAGVYDRVTNRVVFFNTNTVYFYDRTTGLLVQTLPLTGAVLTNTTAYTLGWTGQAGYEILLIDRMAKQVLLFNAATGAFTGMSQLPATAVTNAQFNFSYTNNRLWLFSSALRKWNAYCIWQQTCNAFLPVELLSFTGACNGAPALTWSTGSEQNSSHFDIQRSTDAHEWKLVGRVEAAGNSQQLIEYAWTDPEPLDAAVVYYRLREEDLDGSTQWSDVVALVGCSFLENITTYPNPTSGMTSVRWTALAHDLRGWQFLIFDASGRELVQLPAHTEVDLSPFTAGAYELLLVDPQGVVRGRATLSKY